MKSIEKRFWEKVEIGGPDECWPWTAMKTGGAYGGKYGHFRMFGKMVLAHRAAWILINGVIQKGLCVLHKCDNPSCVNINHLFLGTHQDNMIDMANKGRNVAQIGEANSHAKLRSDDVINIRAIKENTTASCRYISDIFKVNPSTVERIINRTTWVHI